MIGMDRDLLKFTENQVQELALETHSKFKSHFLCIMLLNIELFPQEFCLVSLGYEKIQLSYTFIEAMVVFPLIQTLFLFHKDASRDYRPFIFGSLIQTQFCMWSQHNTCHKNKWGCPHSFIKKNLYSVSILHQLLEGENMSLWIYRYGREGNLKTSQICYSRLYQMFFVKF